MKLCDVLKDIPVRRMEADAQMEVTGVSCDSRSTAPGELFVAVRGYETDGHAYIPQAAERGAAVILCEEPPAADVPYVLVDNSRRALAFASRNWYGDPASQLTIVGVTGTNGKTTSTILIKHLLETCLHTKVGLIGTNENIVGERHFPAPNTTPESCDLQRLFRMMVDEGCTHVVMEVSSHAIALDRVAGLKFAVGLFTNLSQDHMDFHKTMENYADTKARLFDQCCAGAVNLDDAWAGRMLEHAPCPMLTFACTRRDADLVANDVRLSADGVRFVAMAGGRLQRVHLAIPGMFSVYNALGVIACGLQLGLSLEDCAAALETAPTVKGRVERVPTDGDYSIFIDYAVTPDALENVLKTLRPVAQGRLVILFGCGGDRDRKKRPIMGKIAADNADFVIVTSDNPRTEKPEDIVDEIAVGLRGVKTPYQIIVDRREAIAWAIDHHLPGDLIVLAGKGHETYQIIGKTKHHMDEREIVAEHLARRAGEKTAQ